MRTTHRFKRCSVKALLSRGKSRFFGDKTSFKILIASMMLSLGSIQGYIVLLLLRSLSGFVLKSQLTRKDRVFVGGAIAALNTGVAETTKL